MWPSQPPQAGRTFLGAYSPLFGIPCFAPFDLLKRKGQIFTFNKTLHIRFVHSRNETINCRDLYVGSWVDNINKGAAWFAARMAPPVSVFDLLTKKLESILGTGPPDDFPLQGSAGRLKIESNGPG
jgi:hypothetical protein